MPKHTGKSMHSKASHWVAQSCLHCPPCGVRGWGCAHQPLGVGGPGPLRSFHPPVTSSLERLHLRAPGRGAHTHCPGGSSHTEACPVFEYESHNGSSPLYRSVYKSIKKVSPQANRTKCPPSPRVEGEKRAPPGLALGPSPALSASPSSSFSGSLSLLDTTPPQLSKSPPRSTAMWNAPVRLFPLFSSL